MNSALQIFFEMLEDYKKRSIFVCFVKLRPSLKLRFLKSGIIDSKDGDRLFNSIDEAKAYIRTRSYVKQSKNTDQDYSSSTDGNTIYIVDNLSDKDLKKSI